MKYRHLQFIFIIVFGLFGLSTAQAQVSLHGIYTAAPIAGVNVLLAVHDNNSVGVFIWDYNQHQVGHNEVGIDGTGAFSSTLVGYTVAGQLSSSTTSASLTGTLTSGSTPTAFTSTRSAFFGPANNQPYIGRFEGIAAQNGLVHRVGVAYFIDSNLNLYAVHERSGVLTGGVGTVTPNSSNNGGTFALTTVSGVSITGTFADNALTMTGTFTENGITDDFTAVRAYALNRLGNLSARGNAGQGEDVLIGGFIVSGGAKTVYIRTLGPSLGKLGISVPLLNPSLSLFQGSKVIATNVGWTTAPNASDIQKTGAEPLANGDCAILMTLEPGGYTAQVSSTTNTPGVATIEVFEVNLD